MRRRLGRDGRRIAQRVSVCNRGARGRARRVNRAPPRARCRLPRARTLRGCAAARRHTARRATMIRTSDCRRRCHGARGAAALFIRHRCGGRQRRVERLRRRPRLRGDRRRARATRARALRHCRTIGPSSSRRRASAPVVVPVVRSYAPAPVPCPYAAPYHRSSLRRRRVARRGRRIRPCAGR